MNNKNIHLKPFLIFFSAFLFIYTISASLNAQTLNLDNDYIQSLPENIREDVISELESTNDDDAASNLSQKRPSSQVSKLKTVQKWEAFLKESNLKESERYGMRLFQSMQTSFMPINEPNLNGDYVLDFGDVLEIQFIGQKSNTVSVEVKRDGSINIEDYGKIFVSGLSLQQANDLLKASINSAFIGTEVYVTLSSIRDIQVLVAGNSQFPGIYTLNGNSDILHALNVSGGISENGSFRAIDIKRNGKIIKTVDIYEALILGNNYGNDRLRSGDSIYVRPVMNLVRAGNGFNRKGLFELKDGETFEDLIKYAGNLSKDIKNDQLVINRIVNGSYKTSVIPRDDFKKTIVKNNDAAYAEEHSIKRITIKGEVKNPGTYEISSGEKLSSIIKRAGGYTDSAYAFGGRLFREKAKQIEQSNNERAYQELIKFISTSSSSGSGEGSISSLPLILSELKDLKPLGRVVTEFDMLNIEQNPKNDTFLDNGDEIYIPKFDQSVYIYGEVSNPGTSRYSSGGSIANYIDKSGGFNLLSNKKQLILIDPNGEATLINSNSISLSILGNTRINDVAIYPGSVIYVPRDIERIKGREKIILTTGVMSNLAFALASLSTISD